MPRVVNVKHAPCRECMPRVVNVLAPLAVDACIPLMLLVRLYQYSSPDGISARCSSVSGIYISIAGVALLLQWYE